MQGLIQRHQNEVFIVDIEYISHSSSVWIVDFEQVNTGQIV